METSLRLEEDVYVLYAVWDKECPNRFSILEVYKDKEAYDRHLNSPHLRKYFQKRKRWYRVSKYPKCLPSLGKFG